MSDNFVANIKVERVRKTSNQDRHSASHGSVARDVVETMNITVKSSTLDGLKTKVAAHVNLIDEEDI